MKLHSNDVTSYIQNVKSKLLKQAGSYISQDHKAWKNRFLKVSIFKMAKLVLLTTLLILILVTPSTPTKTKDIDQCPDKWVLFGHSCYQLIRQRHRWHDAQAVCKNLNSSLVNIGSNEEDQFVIKLGHTKGVSLWTGLSDVVEEGHFQWTDTQDDPEYTNWYPGQPDNSKRKEDCAVLWYEHEGKWKDADCENKFAAVCEKPSDDDDDDDHDDDIEESKDIPRCPDKWLVFGHSCYKLLIENHTWHDSQAMCKALNSSLVNIGSKEEDQFAVRLAHKYAVTVWIGLTDSLQEGNFVWVDTHDHPIYTHWLPGEPKSYNGKENCATLLYDHGGRWNSDSCDIDVSAICEKPSDD